MQYHFSQNVDLKATSFVVETTNFTKSDDVFYLPFALCVVSVVVLCGHAASWAWPKMKKKQNSEATGSISNFGHSGPQLRGGFGYRTWEVLRTLGCLVAFCLFVVIILTDDGSSHLMAWFVALSFVSGL